MDAWQLQARVDEITLLKNHFLYTVGVKSVQVASLTLFVLAKLPTCVCVSPGPNTAPELSPPTWHLR